MTKRLGLKRLKCRFKAVVNKLKFEQTFYGNEDATQNKTAEDQGKTCVASADKKTGSSACDFEICAKRRTKQFVKDHKRPARHAGEMNDSLMTANMRY